MRIGGFMGLAAMAAFRELELYGEGMRMRVMDDRDRGSHLTGKKYKPPNPSGSRAKRGKKPKVLSFR